MVPLSWNSYVINCILCFLTFILWEIPTLKECGYALSSYFIQSFTEHQLYPNTVGWMDCSSPLKNLSSLKSLFCKLSCRRLLAWVWARMPLFYLPYSSMSILVAFFNAKDPGKKSSWKVEEPQYYSQGTIRRQSWRTESTWALKPLRPWLETSSLACFKSQALGFASDLKMIKKNCQQWCAKDLRSFG